MVEGHDSEGSNPSGCTMNINKYITNFFMGFAAVMVFALIVGIMFALVEFMGWMAILVIPFVYLCIQLGKLLDDV